MCSIEKGLADPALLLHVENGEKSNFKVLRPPGMKAILPLILSLFFGGWIAFPSHAVAKSAVDRLNKMSKSCQRSDPIASLNLAQQKNVKTPVNFGRECSTIAQLNHALLLNSDKSDTSHLLYTLLHEKSNRLVLYPGETKRLKLELEAASRDSLSASTGKLRISGSTPDILGTGSNQILIIPTPLNTRLTTGKMQEFRETFRFSISVGKKVNPGTYAFRATPGSNPGDSTRGWIFFIEVRAPHGTVASLSVGPENSVPVYGGISTLTFWVSAQRGKEGLFQGSFEVSNLPQGVTASFEKPKFIATGSSSFPGTLLTIVVPSDLQAGTYDFQVSLTDGKTTASSTGTISIDTRRWKTHQ